jgi:hypothetical protein
MSSSGLKNEEHPHYLGLGQKNKQASLPRLVAPVNNSASNNIVVPILRLITSKIQYCFFHWVNTQDKKKEN